MPTPTNPILLVRKIITGGMPTDAEMTSHPPLPCVSEVELLDEVIKLLTDGGYYSLHGDKSWQYTSIPAIKYVRQQTNWSLAKAGAFVNKIKKEFARQISAARVVSSQ